ncbi:ribonuclease Z [bacterium BMS3Abin05]|nr:ribonuclease Z [bacterium BMS3Abin05]GBE27639.1 ribonuclease Z [bacterium BMS3Bbin03]
MRWHVLGSASGLTVANRFHSAYLLEDAGKFLLIDAGGGTSRALAKLEKPLLPIEAVLISHTHPDHAAGLPLLLQFMMMSKRTAPLDIFLPAFYKDFFAEQLYRFYIFPEKWPFPIRIHALEKTFDFWNSLRVTLFPTGHLSAAADLARLHGVGAESYGFRFEAGGSTFIYTSDILSVEAISPGIPAADWLMIEGAHTSLEEICRLAVEKKIDHVRVTHIPPELEGQERSLKEIVQKYGLQDFKLTWDGEIIEW